MKLFIDKDHSKWQVMHKKYEHEDGKTHIGHFLLAEVKYEENNEIKTSFSRLKLSDDFFYGKEVKPTDAENAEKVEEAEPKKKSKKKEFKDFKDALKEFTPMADIPSILKDGTFDVEPIPVDASRGVKRHINYLIIPKMEKVDEEKDRRILVLGGFKGDHGVFFESKASVHVNGQFKGKGVVLSYAQSKDQKSEEQIKKETEIKGDPDKVKTTFVKEVQFAALLEDGDMVAYRVFNYERNYGRVMCRIHIIENINGKPQSREVTMRDWKNNYNNRIA